MTDNPFALGEAIIRRLAYQLLDVAGPSLMPEIFGLPSKFLAAFMAMQGISGDRRFSVYAKMTEQELALIVLTARHILIERGPPVKVKKLERISLGGDPLH